MPNTIHIVSSMRDNLTWRDYPDKEENDKFYDEHLARCRRSGRNYANHEAGIRYRSYRADAPLIAQEDLVEVFDNRMFSYSRRATARNAILTYNFTSRLKAADREWIYRFGGRLPQDCWIAFWEGYKEVTEREAYDPMPMPQEGELWRDENGELVVWLGEKQVTVSFMRQGVVAEVPYQIWFLERENWRIV